jgi:LPXTG-motif cell wall-anchored protein
MRITKFLGLAVGAAAAVAFAAPASAQTIVEDIIVIPVDSVLFADPGTVTLIASEPVPERFQGLDCIAEVEAQNQSSIHPNNDLIIQSGSTSGEVDDYESEAFASTGASVPLTLGTTVDVSQRMGPAGVSSGGAVITIDCTLAFPPETTEPAPTTTVAEVLPPAQTPTPPAAASPSPQQPATLPATGIDGTTWTAIAAVVLLAGGSGLVVAARRTR